jgi:S-adenosylmethionine:tRNA ribosyltransferase-isomerase
LRARPDSLRVMRLEEFDYVLPEECVAQEPCARRDAARLMVLDRRADRIVETTFDRIGDHLDPGDLLVLNDTRVFPARLRARKPTGGRVDLLLVGHEPGEPTGTVWRCLASTSRGLKTGTMLRVADGFEVEFLGEAPEGRIRVRLAAHDGDAAAAICRHGSVPLPPYIRRGDPDPREALDRERYQTVYARVEGAVAAPTAGLHFTEDLLTGLRARGVPAATLTLHVGPGTFQPVRVADIEDHRLEPEAYHLPESTARSIAACRGRGGRVVAVGTTVVRVLEDRSVESGGVMPGEGWCGAYITPGHRFRAVDALVTNFHLPRTSLLILVCALAGRERLLSAYRTAVGHGYRFYSYGDAMLIL